MKLTAFYVVALLVLLASSIQAFGNPPTCDANNCCCNVSGCTWYQCSLGGQGLIFCIIQGKPPGCEMAAPENMESAKEVPAPVKRTRKLARAAQQQLLNPVAPASGFTDNGNFCSFNCEWFQRAVRADNPSKPCVYTGTRRESQCTVESICSGCQSTINFPKQILYSNSTDVFRARCPSLPDDIDSISDNLFNLALEKCATEAGCNCVNGPINKDTILVKNN